MRGAMHSLFAGGPIQFTAALGLVMLLGNCLAADLSEQHLGEYRVKAVFLYNFARFIDWPAEAFQKSDELFSICVLGEDPFGQALDDEVAGKTIGGRALAVHRISD